MKLPMKPLDPGWRKPEWEYIHEDPDLFDTGLDSLNTALVNLAIKYGQKINEVKLVLTREPFDPRKFHPKQRVGPKPDGLWYACGFSWVNFLVTSSYYKPLGRYLYQIDIDTRNMAVLDDVGARYFIAENAVSDRYDGGVDINWKRVAREYKGIQACKGSYYDFHNQWDVSSGCIWDLSAITRVTVLHE